MEALSAIHDKGVLHGDILPRNLMVARTLVGTVCTLHRAAGLTLPLERLWHVSCLHGLLVHSCPQHDPNEFPCVECRTAAG
jgi:hypothetical protein